MVLVKFFSIITGTCISTELVVREAASVVVRTVLSIFAFLSSCSCSELTVMLLSIAAAMVGIQFLLGLKQ